MRRLFLQQAESSGVLCMPDHSLDGTLSHEILSALADGQAQPAEAARATRAWRQDADVRRTWHAYHLIGEAMRAPDLAPASDSAAFLQRLRTRLADEPVVLAPHAAPVVGVDEAVSMSAGAAAAQNPAQALKRRMWAGPFAVAASFALIVGVLTANLGGVGSAGDGSQWARSGVGWSEGAVSVGGTATALGPDASFAAARARGQAWQSLDPVLEQAMTVQRPQPNPPDTFSGAAGVVRVSERVGESGR